MCKNILKSWIEDEKNIKIRIRHEEHIKYWSPIILAMLLTGSFISGQKTMLGILFGVILTVIFLVGYLVVGILYLNKYYQHTNTLIKKDQ